MQRILLIIFIIVLLIFNAFMAECMQDAVEEKGYSKEDTPVWAKCFWFGIFGYLYAICLPDIELQNQNQQIIDLLKKANKGNCAKEDLYNLSKTKDDGVDFLKQLSEIQDTNE